MKKRKPSHHPPVHKEKPHRKKGKKEEKIRIETNCPDLSGGGVREGLNKSDFVVPVQVGTQRIKTLDTRPGSVFGVAFFPGHDG
jgi:hypothetical protein